MRQFPSRYNADTSATNDSVCQTAGDRAAAVFKEFYSTPRLGARLLSDGGGPLGFDIQAALQIDYLVTAYPVDAIIETGCNVGDTSDYLARRYSNLPLITCDIDPRAAEVTKRRLARSANATVLTGDSALLLPTMILSASCPLIYLDAHWRDEWPLCRELRSITNGLVVIDDFDINHPGFGFDTYQGTACNAALVSHALPHLDYLHVGNPAAPYPFPCLQVGRRTGRCFLTFSVDTAPLEKASMFRRMDLRPRPAVLEWPAARLRF